MMQCAYCAAACQATGAWLAWRAWLAWHAWQMHGCILACLVGRDPCTLIVACACWHLPGKMCLSFYMMTCSRAVGIRPYVLLDACEQCFYLIGQIGLHWMHHSMVSSGSACHGFRALRTAVSAAL